ncbi:MAG TPA: aspartate aminotransferase family protein [Terriglobales bacterium]|nr:aspartate aminotransferase family protein [Terriglobales bacterium]
METFEQIEDLESRYLLPTYSRYPLALAKGKGVHVWDITGRKYLDFVGGLGVNALGHAHPRIVRVIREQAAKLIHVSNLYYHEYQGALAERLCQVSGLDRAFFSNSGTEAIEGAIKVARAVGHAVGGDAKCRLVALAGSFHGRTFGALSLTGQDKYRNGFEPLLEGVTFVQKDDLPGLRDAIGDDTCAIVMEPIQGEGGIRECSREFLQEARELATKHRAALILDEIQCGVGRTGTMFAYQQMGIVPDIVTLAKPIAAGLPLGAFVVRQDFAQAITAGKHGTTFGGGPLACRVALEVLAIIHDEGLMQQVQRVGAYMHDAFVRLVNHFPDIAVEARGRGMIQAFELRVPGRPVVDAAMAEGILLNVTQDKVLRFLPPYLLQEKHVDTLAKFLRKTLGKIGVTRKETSTARAQKKGESSTPHRSDRGDIAR